LGGPNKRQRGPPRPRLTSLAGRRTGPSDRPCPPAVSIRAAGAGRLPCARSGSFRRDLATGSTARCPGAGTAPPPLVLAAQERASRAGATPTVPCSLFSPKANREALGGLAASGAKHLLRSLDGRFQGPSRRSRRSPLSDLRTLDRLTLQRQHPTPARPRTIRILTGPRCGEDPGPCNRGTLAGSLFLGPLGRCSIAAELREWGVRKFRRDPKKM
jgi:hypothetical protein